MKTDNNTCRKLVYVHRPQGLDQFDRITPSTLRKYADSLEAAGICEITIDIDSFGEVTRTYFRFETDKEVKERLAKRNLTKEQQAEKKKNKAKMERKQYE